MTHKIITKDAMGTVFIIGALAALAILGLCGYFLYTAAIQERSTYSIVALDPESGDVGAAGASCVPISASSLAALAPGQGAAAIQAAFTPKNQAKVFELLSQGVAAREIIEQISGDAYDSNVAIRQYGVVTLQEGRVRTAGFTGNETPDWAGHRQKVQYAVSVQGNTLESEAVVSDALAAFSAADIGPVELSDRLMRALEAASSAGGDSRCNNPDGIQQTAQAAFIAVSRAGQPAFRTPIGQEPSPKDPKRPWLYISVMEAKGGPNPVLDLRSRYDSWRSETLPLCEDCDLEIIAVPPGGDPKPIMKAFLTIFNQIGLIWAAISCCITGILLVVGAFNIFLWRQRQKGTKSTRVYPIPR